MTFDPSGFWNDPSLASPYEGLPSPETDAKWSELIDGLSKAVFESFHGRWLTWIVGMYSLTKEEYEKMSLETTIVPGKPDEYLITIEVFHQLHCLVS